MKLLSIVILALVSVGVGAAGVAVYDNVITDKELHALVAEKDKMIAALNDDAKRLHDGLTSASQKNQAMLDIADSSISTATAIGQGSLDVVKVLRDVQAFLKKLKTDLHAQADPAP